jgi:hypothetical protein
MALIAGSFGVLLAFSSMLLSWYILIPHEDKNSVDHH